MKLTNNDLPSFPKVSENNNLVSDTNFDIFVATMNLKHHVQQNHLSDGNRGSVAGHSVYATRQMRRKSLD